MKGSRSIRTVVPVALGLLLVCLAFAPLGCSTTRTTVTVVRQYESTEAEQYEYATAATKAQRVEIKEFPGHAVAIPRDSRYRAGQTIQVNVKRFLGKVIRVELVR